MNIFLKNITYFFAEYFAGNSFYFCKKSVSFADAFCRKFLADQGAGGLEQGIISWGL